MHVTHTLAQHVPAQMRASGDQDKEGSARAKQGHFTLGSWGEHEERYEQDFAHHDNSLSINKNTTPPWGEGEEDVEAFPCFGAGRISDILSRREGPDYPFSVVFH